MNRIGRKTKRILGLDLGSCTFKVVALETQGLKPLLTHAKVVELPPKADPAIRQAALKELLKEVQEWKFHEVVSVVEDPFACVKEVSVPPMPAGELPGAVRWELQRYVPVPPEELSVDYQLLGEVERDGAKRLKLLAAAIPSATIREHLAFLTQGGLRPTQLLPRAAAVTAWVRHRSETGAGGAAVAVLCLGGRSSEFLVIQAGELAFSRKIPMAGCDLTEAMTGVLITDQGQMGLTLEEAETIKRGYGIPSFDSPQTWARGISSSQVLALMRGSLERLVVEVERSLAFYGESAGQARPASGQAGEIAELLLVRGGAQLKGLADWLKARLGIQVSVPDSGAGIPHAPAAVLLAAGASTSPLVPALGAALSAGSGVNLLPAEVREAARLKAKRTALKGLLTGLIVGAVLIRVGMGIYRRSLIQQMEAFEVEQRAVGRQLLTAQATVAAQERLDQEPDWQELFRQLSQQVPPEIYLTGLILEERALILRGRVRQSHRTADRVLEGFMGALGQGPFAEVRLGSSRQLEQPTPEAEFEVRCLLQ